MRDQIFFSYSHKDRKWLERIQTFLKPLVRDKRLSVWDDTKIKAGTLWREEIENALASAKLAVLLVSSDFLASDFIAEHELPPLLDSANKNGLRILWIAVRDSLYSETEIARYHAVNDPSRPLARFKGAGLDKELLTICLEIISIANIDEKPINREASQTLPPDNSVEGGDTVRNTNPSINGTQNNQQPIVVDNVASLKKLARTHQLIEHVADTATVGISQYPTAVIVNHAGKSNVDAKDISVGWDSRMVLVFSEGTYAIGISYQQGLSPCPIIIQLSDGRTYEYEGNDFFPETIFFGFYSPQFIRSIEIRTVGFGSLYLRSFYFYSNKRHKRKYER